MIVRGFVLLISLSLVLASCAPVTPAGTPGAVATNTPAPADTPVPVSANWRDRIKECVTKESFLATVLPELDRYESITNSAIVFPPVSITETVRGCITLPEDLYPRAQREFTSEEGNAALGYISNWEQACGGIHAGALPGNCTGDGYEGVGRGIVLLRAKSAVPHVPDLVFRFAIVGLSSP